MTVLPPIVAEKVAGASGFIFDMDGTIALGDAASGGHAPLPHAPALIARIKARGIPVRVFTNGTAKPPAAYAASLRRAGFDVADEEMMTPSSSAAAWFVRNKVARVRVLGVPGCAAPLADAGIEVVAPAASAGDVEAIYTGWYREFTFPDLEAACQDVWAGAMLTSASHVPFFAAQGGRAIGSSFAINAMIRSLTGAKLRVLGKPSTAAFSEACRAMGIRGAAKRDVIVVGDDPALEMRMARAGGATGIGVTTGMMTRGSEDDLPASQQPHAVVDSLGAVLEALG